MTALGTLGGFHSLASAVKQNQQPFAAANVVYSAPTVSCTFSKQGASGKFNITVYTTLAAGTISYSITDTGNSSTLESGSVAATSTTVAITGAKKGTSGHTYTASVTQTASGYATAGPVTCTPATITL